MVGGPKMTECLGLDAGSVAGGAEGGADSTRVTENHMETVDSLDRGK